MCCWKRICGGPPPGTKLELEVPMGAPTANVGFRGGNPFHQAAREAGAFIAESQRAAAAPPVVSTLPSAGAGFCSGCGSALDGDGRFCKACGKATV